MIGLSAFTVFALGLRHGADPDHLAAIDNVTRNAYTKTPLLSRFVGTLFAGGHSVMVLALSALIGLLGARYSVHGALIETIGTWVSIVVLIAIAVLNLDNLRRGGVRPAGAKTRLLPRALREGTNALVAIPIGLLFGFGFETSSQIVTYAVAFGANAGVWGAVLVGSMFCLGMIVTDTLDSLIVHRFIAYRSARLPHVMRVWIAAVTVFALAVAGYEILQVSGRQPPFTDGQVSATLVGALGVVFVYVWVQTRRRSDLPTITDPPPVAAALTGSETP